MKRHLVAALQAQADSHRTSLLLHLVLVLHKAHHGVRVKPRPGQKPLIRSQFRTLLGYQAVMPVTSAPTTTFEPTLKLISARILLLQDP